MVTFVDSRVLLNSVQRYKNDLIRLNSKSFFSFILVVHHVLCHFQHLSGFDSIKTIIKINK